MTAADQHEDQPQLSERIVQELQNLRVDAVTAEMTSALAAERVRAILLRGPAIARLLYDAGETRPYSDIDLLVEPSDVEAAGRVAGSHGFHHFDVGQSRRERPSHHEVWLRDRDGVRLELHRSLLGVDAPDDLVWAQFQARTQTLALGVGDAEVAVLAGPPLAVVLALHAAAHGPVFRQPLEDLRRALLRLPTAEWDEAASLAVRLGADAAFAAGLRLVDGGEAVLERNELNPHESPEVVLRASTAPPGALAWEWLAETRGLRRKLAFLARELVPSRDFMRTADVRATRGSLGLLRAYLSRPYRLATYVGPGFRAWRAARTRSSRDLDN